MPIVVVKIGTFENPPSVEELEHFEGRLAKLKETEESLSDITFFVTRHGCEFDRYSLDLSEDNRPQSNDLMSILAGTSDIGVRMSVPPVEVEVPVVESAVENNEEEIAEAEIAEAQENLNIVPDLDDLGGK